MRPVTAIRFGAPGDDDGDDEKKSKRKTIDPDGGGYNINDFYCTSTDTKGHSRSVTVNIPPQWHVVLSIMISDPDIPYTTMNDVIRDSVIHRQRWIAENKGSAELQEAVELSRFKADLDRLATETASNKATMAMANEMLQEARDSGDIEAVQFTLEGLKRFQGAVKAKGWKLAAEELVAKTELWLEGQ